MFKTALLCPALKDCISKLNNNSIFKLVLGRQALQDAEFCFSFSSVAAPGFFLILPGSHRVMLLYQTGCTLCKGGLCLHLQHGARGGEGREETARRSVRLP